MGIGFDRPELAAPGGGWTAPPAEQRRWQPRTVEPLPIPELAVYCAGNPKHGQCIGYDPQTKAPCSCSCHDKD